MNRKKPIEYRCTPNCPYRRETPGMCNAGAKQIPIKDNCKCLYPGEAQRRDIEMGQQGVDYREIAAHKWNLNPKPPEIRKFLKIVGNTLNLP